MTLDEIRRHPYFPFSDFKTQDLSFLMLELYWVELFKAMVQAGGGSVGGWVPRSAADREEGNPILNLIDRSVQPVRALRVIQRFNDTHLPALDLATLAPLKFKDDAYVAFVPDLNGAALDDDGETAIEELVISSDVSEACEKLLAFFVQRWCIQRISEAEMRSALNTYWARVKASLVQMD
jgi:hypothetical protein